MGATAQDPAGVSDWPFHPFPCSSHLPSAGRRHHNGKNWSHPILSWKNRGHKEQVPHLAASWDTGE